MTNINRNHWTTHRLGRESKGEVDWEVSISTVLDTFSLAPTKSTGVAVLEDEDSGTLQIKKQQILDPTIN